MESQEYIPAQDFGGPTTLPIYKGYTVDCRLREFRKIDDSGLLASYPFREDFGDTLLTEMIKKGLVPQEVISELF